MNGEWSANRIELDSDYSGSTNLDANIGATITADIVKKRSPKKNKAVPIASSDISSAVADLDLGTITSRGTTKHQSTDRAKKPKKVKPPSQSSSITDSLSEYSKVLLSDRSSYPVVHNPNVSVHIDDTDRVDSSETSRSLLKPPLHHLSNFTNSSSIKSASSPSARSILSTSSKLSTQSKQSTTSNYTQSSKGITGSDIIAADQNLEPEQIRMLNEIDNITPEEQQRRRYEMNLRMADRVAILCYLIDFGRVSRKQLKELNNVVNWSL